MTTTSRAVCDNRISMKREVRIPWSRDLEQMMVAFIAFELGVEARRIIAGRPPRKKNYEQTVGRKDCGDRTTDAPGSDDKGSLVLGRCEPKYRDEIPGGLRR